MNPHNPYYKCLKNHRCQTSYPQSKHRITLSKVKTLSMCFPAIFCDTETSLKKSLHVSTCGALFRNSSSLKGLLHTPKTNTNLTVIQKINIKKNTNIFKNYCIKSNQQHITCSEAAPEHLHSFLYRDDSTSLSVYLSSL